MGQHNSNLLRFTASLICLAEGVRVARQPGPYGSLLRMMACPHPHPTSRCLMNHEPFCRHMLSWASGRPGERTVEHFFCWRSALRAGCLLLLVLPGQRRLAHEPSSQGAATSRDGCRGSKGKRSARRAVGEQTLKTGRWLISVPLA